MTRKPKQTKETNGKPEKRGGAPALNRNNWRHGLYSPRLPKTLSYPDKMACQFRRNLEDAVFSVHAEIDLTRAALIHTASEAQKVASANRYEKKAAKEKGVLTADLALRFDAEYLIRVPVKTCHRANDLSSFIKIRNI